MKIMQQQMSKFAEIKNKVQQIIDLIGNKQTQNAHLLLLDLEELLDEMFDFSDNDADLIEISRYKVLLQQLNQKITNS
jgi:vacuolar-type H+-ATPase catalytic subunit A/Vma1